MGVRLPLAESQQVAEYLGVPLRTLDQWAYRGVGPRYSKVGRHRRYRWKDIESWLDQRAGGGATGGPDAA